MAQADTDTPHGSQRCGRPKRQGGDPCGRPAGWGTDHVGTGACKLHGGCSPSGRKHAQQQQAVAAVATYGLPREIDPHTALLEELHRTAGHVAWLGLKVAELEAHEVVIAIEGTEREHSDLVLVTDAKPNVWVTLYQSERKHFAQIAKTCVDVGIEERRVRLAEQQGAMFARALDGILTELGVRNHPEAPAVVRRHLTALDGGLVA